MTDNLYRTFLVSGDAYTKYKQIGFSAKNGLYLYYPKNTYNCGVFYIYSDLDAVRSMIAHTRKQRRRQGIKTCSYALKRLTRNVHAGCYLLVFLPVKTKCFELLNVRTILDYVVDNFGISPLKPHNIPLLADFSSPYAKLLRELKQSGYRKLSPYSLQMYKFLKLHLNYLKRTAK